MLKGPETFFLEICNAIARNVAEEIARTTLLPCNSPAQAEQLRNKL
jgi:hypothetical protein